MIEFVVVKSSTIVDNNNDILFLVQTMYLPVDRIQMAI